MLGYISLCLAVTRIIQVQEDSLNYEKLVHTIHYRKYSSTDSCKLGIRWFTIEVYVELHVVVCKTLQFTTSLMQPINAFCASSLVRQYYFMFLQCHCSMKWLTQKCALGLVPTLWLPHRRLKSASRVRMCVHPMNHIQHWIVSGSHPSKY